MRHPGHRDATSTTGPRGCGGQGRIQGPRPRRRIQETRAMTWPDTPNHVVDSTHPGSKCPTSGHFISQMTRHERPHDVGLWEGMECGSSPAHTERYSKALIPLCGNLDFKTVLCLVCFGLLPLFLGFGPPQLTPWILADCGEHHVDGRVTPKVGETAGPGRCKFYDPDNKA